MIKMESPQPVTALDFPSEVVIKDLTPAKRDWLVDLLNTAGFVVRDINEKEVAVGEIVLDGGVYKIGAS